MQCICPELTAFPIYSQFDQGFIANSTQPDEFETVRAEPLTRTSSASAVTEQPSAEALTA